MVKTVLILLAGLLALHIGVSYWQAYRRRKVLEERRRKQAASSRDKSPDSPPTDL